MTDKEKEKMALGMYDTMKEMHSVMSLPTHSSMERTLYFSIGLFFCTTICRLIGFYTFLSWQGCLLCVLALVIFLFVERKENDTLLRMYSNARKKSLAMVNKLKRNETVESSTDEYIDEEYVEEYEESEEPVEVAEESTNDDFGDFDFNFDNMED